MNGTVLLPALIGWFVGILAFSAILHWLAVVESARSQVVAAVGHPVMSRIIALVVAQSLFHSGLWLIIVLAFVAVHIHRESWAGWLFAGFLASFGMFLAMAASIYRRHVNKVNGNAA